MINVLMPSIPNGGISIRPLANADCVITLYRNYHKITTAAGTFYRTELTQIKIPATICSGLGLSRLRQLIEDNFTLYWSLALAGEPKS